MAQSDGTAGRHDRRAERADDLLAHHSAHGHRGTHRHHRAGGLLVAVRSAGAITDSRHSGTVSSTVRVYRASWNAMKPRIQRVPTP